MADAINASQTMRSFINPLIITLGVIAGLVAAGFLVNGGIQMMTSAGKPEQLSQAKIIIRNALIGLALVIASVTVTSILTTTYKASGNTTTSDMPKLAEVKPAESSGNLVDVLVNATIGLLRNIIETAATPFIGALSYFTTQTPMMAKNASVFNLWLIILAIADVLFILVVILLGFHIMSAPSLGFDELEFKHMVPQLIVIFILMNSSIFLIDTIIGLSNGMIQALQAGFASTDVWQTLSKVASGNVATMQLAALLIFIVFIILSVVLIIYYILRLVTLYIGAVLSPLLLMLWLVPSFKDFVATAFRTYLTTIFVLFIHVVILALAASILLGMSSGENGALDPIMSMFVGIATILALLKTQSVLSQFAYVSTGARAMRKLGGQFTNGVSTMTTKIRTASVTTNTKHAAPSPGPTIVRVPAKKGNS